MAEAAALQSIQGRQPLQAVVKVTGAGWSALQRDTSLDGRACPACPSDTVPAWRAPVPKKGRRRCAAKCVLRYRYQGRAPPPPPLVAELRHLGEDTYRSAIRGEQACLVTSILCTRSRAKGPEKLMLQEPERLERPLDGTPMWVEIVHRVPHNGQHAGGGGPRMSRGSTPEAATQLLAELPMSRQPGLSSMPPWAP